MGVAEVRENVWIHGFKLCLTTYLKCDILLNIVPMYTNKQFVPGSFVHIPIDLIVVPMSWCLLLLQ